MGRVSIKYAGSGSLSNLLRRGVNKKRAEISAAVAALWQAKVMGSRISPSAKRRYSGAITPYKPPRVGAYVQDQIAVLLEKGWKAFDMTSGLLAGATHRSIPIGGKGSNVIRTVSQKKSKKGQWKHPGYRGAKVKHLVERSVKRIVREALSDDI